MHDNKIDNLWGFCGVKQRPVEQPLTCLQDRRRGVPNFHVCSQSGCVIRRIRLYHVRMTTSSTPVLLGLDLYLCTQWVGVLAGMRIPSSIGLEGSKDTMFYKHTRLLVLWPVNFFRREGKETLVRSGPDRVSSGRFRSELTLAKF